MREIEKNLIKKSSEGDMEAFEQIYEISSPYVYRVVYQITNNEQDAQDVTQDVFVKIYNNIKDFNLKSSFKTWAYKISINTAINAVKKRSKGMHKQIDYDVVINSISYGDNPDNRNIEKESSDLLLTSLLQMLNPKQRACIVLREIEGLSYEEISQTLNIKINTVRSRLRRARQNLLNFRKQAGDIE